jgi:transposase
MSIMETMERKQPRARRSFTAEFKAEIVELCQRGDRWIGQVARDFDLTKDRGPGVGAPGRAGRWDAWRRRADQRGRPRAGSLRRENQRLRQDVEILKPATAFLVQETR